MKKIIAILSSLLIPAMAFAASSVMVNDTNATLSWPTNFFSANGVQTTNAIGPLTTRVTNLEARVGTNDAAIIVATNDIHTVTTNVAVLSTNTATKAQGVAATNAQARVAVLEASSVYTNAIPYTSGVVYATSYVGNGGGLTNVSASATGVVSSIIVGSDTNTGALTFTGTGIATNGTGVIKFDHVEYIGKQIVVASNIYEMTVDGPRVENFTLDSVFAKCDAYTVNFTFVTIASNATWRVTTDQFTAVATTNGTAISTNLSVTAGNEWGVRIDDYDPRATQMRITYRIRY